MLDDGVRTTSSIDQAELERRVTAIYAKEYSLGEGSCRCSAARHCWLLLQLSNSPTRARVPVCRRV